MDKAIKIVTSQDAGCEISEDEHAEYCLCVAIAVEIIYGCSCECELGLGTKVRVYGFPDRDEDAVIEGVRSIMQDVWEGGEFWGEPALRICNAN